MRHFIIVKFKPEITGEQISAMIPDIEQLFSNTMEIEGIHNVAVHRNCVDRDNRYDIAIEIEMDRDTLDWYDACEPHHVWKKQYGPMIEKKTIIDWE